MSTTPGNHLAAGWDSEVFRAVEEFSTKLHIWEHWERVYLGDGIFDRRTGPQAAQEFLDDYEGSHVEGTRVLWPERESYTNLMIQRLTLGRASFQAEKRTSRLTRRPASSERTRSGTGMRPTIPSSVMSMS